MEVEAGGGGRAGFFPPLGQTMKLGRIAPTVRQPCLRLANYLTRSLPSPPTTCDYSAAAAKSIQEVYLNDQLGNCVIACMAHVVGVLTGNAGGDPVLFTQDQIVKLYSAIG